ncbi:MAG TPA: VOC family protein [Candidatus Saccharimonadales bacterium]|nr:VOC family protein [Candidatus Saccharimonadales bacterium]
MLGDKTAVATIAVKDMDAAKKFYEGTLGLTVDKVDPGGGGNLYKSGDSNVLVYPSQFAGTNKATAASWGVGDDLEKIVADLKSKGVTFEQYDNIPGAKREGEIHTFGDMKAAWFKDPDGNILNLVNQM